MAIHFRIEPVEREIFANLLNAPESQLHSANARWITVNSCPDYPCRVSLTDAAIGERVLALSWCHHDVDSPYRACGPIFVREFAETCTPEPDEIPPMLTHRLLSLRGYDRDAMMIAAAVAPGIELADNIRRLFDQADVEYLHIHNAMPGCFNCAVYRA